MLKFKSFFFYLIYTMILYVNNSIIFVITYVYHKIFSSIKLKINKNFLYFSSIFLDHYKNSLILKN